MAPSSRAKIVATNLDFAQRLDDDLSARLAKVIAENPGILPQEAILKAQEAMLKDNPFVPPKDGRCIINSLPVELLAHIFLMGVAMDREGDDDEFEEVVEGEEKRGLEEELDKLGERSESKSTSHGAAVEEIVDDDGNNSEWEDEEEDNDEESDDNSSDWHGEDEDSDEEDEEEEPHIPFEVLASHVCRHWRETALNTPDLWNWIAFVAPPQWEMYDAYLQRAKGQPLTLEIDGSRPDVFEPEDHPDHPGFDGNAAYDGRAPPFFSSKEIADIMNVIIPFVPQWHRVDITMTDHEEMEKILKLLHDVPEAPMLESLHLHDEKVCDDYDTVTEEEFAELTLPFHGKAPNLETIDLWGVHLDWDGAISLFQNVKHLNLAYHVKRPSWSTFSAYLSNSHLERMELDASGPALLNASFPVTTPVTSQPTAYYTPATSVEGMQFELRDPWEWPRHPFETASLQELSLAGHDPEYADALATKLFFPNLKSLSLSYQNGDFTDVVKAYTKPLHGASSRRSTFQLLESLQILELGHVDSPALEAMLESLMGLSNLSLGTPEDYTEEAVPEKIWNLLLENVKTVQELVKSSDKDKGVESKPQPEAPTASTSSQPLTIVPPDPSAPLPKVLEKEVQTVSTLDVHHRLLLPHLTSLQTRDVLGSELREFAELRKAIGVPLKNMHVHSSARVSRSDERWLRDNLEEFEFFSDSEEEDDPDDDIVSDWVDTDDFMDGDEEDSEDEEEDSDGHEHDASEDDDEWSTEDDDGGDDDMGGSGGRVARARNIPHASGRGAASTHVTTGLSNLD